MKLAALKDCGGGTKNEVGGPFDITILEILSAGVAVNSVLASQKMAIVENSLIPGNIDRQGLTDRSRAVLKTDIRRVKPGGVQKKAGRIAGSKSYPGGRVDQSIVIAIAEDRSRNAFADYRDIDLVAGQGQGGLLIGPVLDVNDRPGSAVVGNGVEGILDVGVVSRSILGDDNVVTGLGVT